MTAREIAVRCCLFNNLFIVTHLNHSKEELREKITAGCIGESCSQPVPFLSWTSKTMRAFQKSQQQAPVIVELPVGLKTAEGSAWVKPWTTGCDKGLLLNPLLASCKNWIPRTSCISPAFLQLERESALTLMRIHYFKMSLGDHCFALSFVFSVQARPVCNLKAPIKTLPPSNVHENLNKWKNQAFPCLNEEMVYCLPANTEKPTVRQDQYKLRWLKCNDSNSIK